MSDETTRNPPRTRGQMLGLQAAEPHGDIDEARRAHEVARLKLETSKMVTERRTVLASPVDKAFSRYIDWMDDPGEFMKVLAALAIVVGAAGVLWVVGMMATSLGPVIFQPLGLYFNTYSIVSTGYSGEYYYEIRQSGKDSTWAVSPEIPSWEVSEHYAAHVNSDPKGGYYVSKTENRLPCFYVQKTTSWGITSSVSPCYLSATDAAKALNGFWWTGTEVGSNEVLVHPPPSLNPAPVPPEPDVVYRDTTTLVVYGDMPDANSYGDVMAVGADQVRMMDFDNVYKVVQ